MALLLVTKLPAIDSYTFPITNPVEVQYGPCNFQNITLEPLGKGEYHVDVAISPYGNKPFLVDFWVVNETGFYLLAESLSFDVLRTEYPGKPPFNSIKAYAKEINITGTKYFELTNVDHDGTYCLVLVSFFEDYLQNATVAVEEKYLGSPRPLLEPNLTYIAIVPVIVAVGGYFILISRKRPSRRAKINMAMACL